MFYGHSRSVAGTTGSATRVGTRSVRSPRFARSTQLGLNRRPIALADVTLETLFWEWKGGRASFKFSPPEFDLSNSTF